MVWNGGTNEAEASGPGAAPITLNSARDSIVAGRALIEGRHSLLGFTSDLEPANGFGLGD